MPKVRFPESATLADALTQRTAESKGSSFYSILNAFERSFPELRREDLLARMDPEPARILASDQMLAASWYPVAWYLSMHQAIQETAGGGNETAWNLGYMGTKADFGERGLYHFMARTLGPKTVLSLGGRVFGLYWRPAGMRIMGLKGRNAARATWTGCLGFNELLWHDIFGSIAAILEVSGCPLKELQVLKASQDLSALLIEAEWTTTA